MRVRRRTFSRRSRVHVKVPTARIIRPTNVRRKNHGMKITQLLQGRLTTRHSSFQRIRIMRCNLPITSALRANIRAATRVRRRHVNILPCRTTRNAIRGPPTRSTTSLTRLHPIRAKMIMFRAIRRPLHGLIIRGQILSTTLFHPMVRQGRRYLNSGTLRFVSLFRLL